MNSSISSSSHIHRRLIAPNPMTFLIVTLGMVFFALLGVGSVNTILDPLWHFGGNRISGVNFAYDERRMRLNSVAHQVTNYDCILFGSSRATLLDVNNIDGYQCVNISFSNGHVNEFVRIASYLKHQQMDLKYLIVSVNEVSFSPLYEPKPDLLPNFIVNNRRPSILNDYLTLDSLSLSWRTFRGSSPIPRAYNLSGKDEPRGFILSWAGDYMPKQELYTHSRLLEPYDVSKLAQFRTLLSIFPKARSLAIVTPVSYWEQAKISLTGNLGRYVELRHQLSLTFSEGLIDFSLPEPMMSQTDITYDGLHYRSPINDRMIEKINGRADFGVQVRNLALADYKDLIVPKVEKFREQRKLRLLLYEER
jgi:hypothetical protein